MYIIKENKKNKNKQLYSILNASAKEERKLKHC